ncbi:hypothetical protein SAMN05216197_11912 [Pseudomonas graminis]|uniref:BIG2 domain-containing protein n=2 Tax=Pseudomonas graminis TaxID=158627 RepID=A0A1I0G2K4_9PSED|nr:hypothetical protein SAMN05216197_11912 [Pseudomonas graminis]
MRRRLRTLFPPLDRSYKAAALRPLLIGGMITPVEGGDGGINADIGCQDFVLIAIDPWQGMRENDHLDVYWDTDLVAIYDVLPEDINERIVLTVSGEYIKDGWVEKVFYRLTHADTGRSDDSGALRVKIKLEPPGGFDRHPALPGHSELKAPVLPADIVENGVDAAWAQRGFPLVIETYPDRMARDTISLAWGDVVIAHLVSEGEAAGDDPIEIPVDQATILAAGDSENLLVDYEVYDEVYNFATPRSMQTIVSVEAGAWRLEAPIIGNGTPTIDLEDLGSDSVPVYIKVTVENFALEDVVEMTWRDDNAANEQPAFTYSFTIDNLSQIYQVDVPNAHIRALLGGKGRATYVLKKINGAPWLSSKRATVSIVGHVPLPAPNIIELIGDTLAPDEERAHVEIPNYGMEIGDFIVLKWLGTQSNGSIHLHEDTHNVTGNEAGGLERVYFPVMGEHISILNNGSLDVSYTVSNDSWLSADTRRSEHLLVKVGQHSAQLPAPTVEEAPDGVLDPEQYPESATLRIAYEGTRAGDTITWYWKGISDEGSGTDSFPITTGTAGKPLDFPIARALIEPNINNEVKAMYTLKRGTTGLFEYSATLNLVIGKLIGELLAPTVVEARDGVLDPMDALNGATVQVRYDSMEEDEDVITHLWLGSPGAGTPADETKPGAASGLVEFSVTAAVIGANIGREVSVSYRVKRYTAEKQSDLLRLPILPFGNPDKDLPHPAITQADSQTLTLNLATFTGNATTTVAKWPFSASGQRVWLRIEGETGSGGPYAITLLDGAVLTSAQASDGLSVTLPRTELEKLGQDTRLTVICNVAFDGTASESGAVPFPRVAYAFKLHHDWVKPQIVSIKDGKGEVADGGTTFDTDLSISGTSTLETELEILDSTTRLTTVKSNGSGAWSGSLQGLTVKSYSLTANALDGSGLVSSPRRLEVLANVKPVINQVLDSRGPVSDGGTTVDTSLTISGKASPDRQVELFDNGVSKGVANTNGSGEWSLTVSALSVASHAFKAKALYGTQPESDIWTVIIAAAVTPTITHIRDMQGAEIPPDGFTVDTGVALTGTASAGLEVEIFDGAASRQKVTADAGGQWTLTLTGLSVAQHDMKVRANYGSNPESAVRKFTVTAVVTPTITRVEDPQGNAVSNGGSTYANTVTASGKASIGQSVEVFDGASSKGTASVNASGDWLRSVSGLSVGAHSLTTRALYANNPVSSPWTLNVQAATAPTLSVRDSRGEVGQGSTTTETTVTASGTAVANAQVEVFDKNASKGTTTAGGGGAWSLSVGVALGSHSIKAVGKYADNPSSETRDFRVVSPIPDFVLDTSPVSLNGALWGLSSYPGHAPLSWPAGTTYRRNPSSGAAPYSYTSSDSSKVMVDSTGFIKSVSNGTATINVQDQQGRRGSYTVTVSNVTMVTGIGKRDYKDANKRAAERGLHLMNMDQLRNIYSQYGNRFPMGDMPYWSTNGAGFLQNYTKNMVTGVEGTGIVTLPGSYCGVLAI